MIATCGCSGCQVLERNTEQALHDRHDRHSDITHAALICSALKQHTPVWFDHGRQRAILHVLQDDIQVAARLEAADVLDDVFVVEGFEQVDLSHDASQVLLANTCQADLLDGHHIASGRVDALVHLQQQQVEAFAVIRLVTKVTKSKTEVLVGRR
jgi:hypothetical protein